MSLFKQNSLCIEDKEELLDKIDAVNNKYKTLKDLFDLGSNTDSRITAIENDIADLKNDLKVVREILEAQKVNPPVDQGKKEEIISYGGYKSWTERKREAIAKVTDPQIIMDRIKKKTAV